MIEALQAERPHREMHRMNPTIYQVADLFCGAGGSSTGAEKAIEEIGGRMELVAVNHWPIAVQTHQLNHPTAQHYLQDLDKADPEEIVPNGYLDLLMASPECRFYSRARGGKPIHSQGRMHPWIVHRWLTSLNVKTLICENVPEFTDWGPLQGDGRPDKTKKGMYFEEWVKSLWGLGYQAEWRMLNAANYGDATTRIRFFLQARNDGKPIRWPEATHSKTGSPSLLQELPKWRTAREIIDWSNPGRSLLDDPKYRKKPLAEKTRRRIAKGLERFGGPLAHLYIRLLNLPPENQGGSAATPENQERSPAQESFILNRNGENGSTRVHSVDNPIPTATTRGAGYLVEPTAHPFHGSDRQHTAPRSPDEPLHTITTLTGGGLYLAEAKAQPFVGANHNHNVPKGVGAPVPSATTAQGGGNFPVKPDMKAFMLGQQSGGAPRQTSEPVPTVTTDGAISLIQPSIIEYYGQSNTREVTEPLSTILSIPKARLSETDTGQVLRPEPQRRRRRAPTSTHDKGQIRPGRSDTGRTKSRGQRQGTQGRRPALPLCGQAPGLADHLARPRTGPTNPHPNRAANRAGSKQVRPVKTAATPYPQSNRLRHSHPPLSRTSCPTSENATGKSRASMMWITHSQPSRAGAQDPSYPPRWSGPS